MSNPRSLVAQIAGSIAAGMCSDLNGFVYNAKTGDQRDELATASVDLALRILERVDALTVYVRPAQTSLPGLGE